MVSRNPLGRLLGLSIALGSLALAAPLPASAAAAASHSLPAFTCASKSGGQQTARGTVYSIRAAHHPGYDRLVFGFPTTNHLPSYRITMQRSSTFIQDASGRPVTLEGSAGLKVVFKNADVVRGVPSDLKPRLPEIREVKKIGEFERVVSYGVGLSRAACYRAFELTGPGGGPTRLVIDVRTRGI